MNEIEKMQIMEEELYREEVRKQLSNKKNKTIGSVINSPFFLWFLSVVIVGLTSFIYNKNTESKKTEKEVTEKIIKLDFEVENRIAQFWFNLEPFINKSTSPQNGQISFNKPMTIDSIRPYWKAFKNEPSKSLQLSSGIYNEFENRSTPALMLELASLLKNKLSKDISEYLENGKLKHNLSLDDSISVLAFLHISNAAIFVSNDQLFDPFIIKEYTEVNLKKDNRNKLVYPIELWTVFNKVIVRNRWNTSFNYRRALWDYSDYNPLL